MIRGAAGHVALVALLLAARTAVAAPPTHSFVEALRVDPNECFDAASLAPVLVRWLGRSEVDRRVEIEIAGQPAGAEGLTLRVRREGQIVGERRFPGLAAPCDEVRAAVGLAAALAVDALSLEVPAAPAAVVLERGPAPPVRSSSRRFSSAVDAVVLVGVLPAPTGALAPGFGVRLAPAFELRLGGLLSGVGSVGLDGGSVAASLLAGRADGCGALAGDIVRARACLGLTAGRLQTAPAHLAPALSPSVPWAATVGRLDARVSVAPWLGFVLGADAIVPLTRPRFEVVTPAGAPIASTGLPVFGGAVSLGPEITFR